MAMVQCQRMGCNAKFSPDKNEEPSCVYHPGPPLFHDGGKQWSCCKQRSHDFSEFLGIPGCARGKHSSEKQQMKAAPSPNKPVTVIKVEDGSVKAICARCRQGFFCSEHGSSSLPAAAPPKPKLPSSNPANPAPMQICEPEKPEAAPAAKTSPASAKIIDLDAKLSCKNKGCGKTYTERENHEEACKHHPGPAVFHDRSRGWACCDVHAKEFDEFLALPPCTKGWHSSQ